MRKLLVISVLFFIEGVLAISGVSPGSYDVNFEPFLEKNFTFIFLADEGVTSRVYAEGELAKYVFLDKIEILGSEKVVVNLKLPEKIDSYGVNRIRIGAKQLSSDVGGVGIVSDAGGIINVFVPYPGKNLFVDVSVPNKNVGEILEVNLKLVNQGNESLLAEPVVQIFKEEEVVGDLDFESVLIESLGSFEKRVYFNTSEMSLGDYGVVALVDYGVGVFARSEGFFKLGDFFVDIIDYPEAINKSELEEFNIRIESFCNNEISNLYAKVSFENRTFVSPSIKLKPWEKREISVFVDSSGLKEKETEFLITLYYGEAETSKMVSLKLIESGNLYYLLFIFLAIGLLIFIYWKIRIS